MPTQDLWRREFRSIKVLISKIDFILISLPFVSLPTHSLTPIRFALPSSTSLVAAVFNSRFRLRHLRLPVPPSPSSTLGSVAAVFDTQFCRRRGRGGGCCLATGAPIEGRFVLRGLCLISAAAEEICCCFPLFSRL